MSAQGRHMGLPLQKASSLMVGAGPRAGAKCNRPAETPVATEEGEDRRLPVIPDDGLDRPPFTSRNDNYETRDTLSRLHTNKKIIHSCLRVGSQVVISQPDSGRKQFLIYW